MAKRAAFRRSLDLIRGDTLRFFEVFKLTLNLFSLLFPDFSLKILLKLFNIFFRLSLLNKTNQIAFEVFVLEKLGP